MKELHVTRRQEKERCERRGGELMSCVCAPGPKQPEEKKKRRTEPRSLGSSWSPFQACREVSASACAVACGRQVPRLC